MQTTEVQPLEKNHGGRGPIWKGFEEDLIKPFLDVFPEEDRAKVAQLTGRTVNAVNVKWSKMRQAELARRAREIVEGKEAARVDSLKRAVIEPNKDQTLSLGGASIPILEVNQTQKELMDQICTVVHNVNGKYFILKVV